MNVVILLLGFTATVFAQAPTNNNFLKNYNCQMWMASFCRAIGYAERSSTDAFEIYYNFGREVNCNTGMAFYAQCCTCIPFQATVRPKCDILFEHTADEKLKQKTGNHHNTYSKPINALIRKETAFTCFYPSAYVQLDFTANNDFGTQFNIELNIRYNVDRPTVGERVIFFTNEFCGIGMKPTLKLEHTPSTDTYTVQSELNTGSCRMNRQGTGNTVYTVQDVIKIRYDNGEMSVQITDRNVECAINIGYNILEGFSQTMSGTMCPLKIGSMGTHSAKVCYKTIHLDRDCIKRP